MDEMKVFKQMVAESLMIFYEEKRFTDSSYSAEENNALYNLFLKINEMEKIGDESRMMMNDVLMSLKMLCDEKFFECLGEAFSKGGELSLLIEGMLGDRGHAD